MCHFYEHNPPRPTWNGVVPVSSRNDSPLWNSDFSPSPVFRYPGFVEIGSALQGTGSQFRVQPTVSGKHSVCHFHNRLWYVRRYRRRRWRWPAHTERPDIFHGHTGMQKPWSVFIGYNLTLWLTSSKSTFSQTSKENMYVMTIILIFNLSKLWKATFFILCDVIFMVRLQEKFEIDHSWSERVKSWHLFQSWHDSVMCSVVKCNYAGSNSKVAKI